MAAAIAATMPEKQSAPSSAPTAVATHEAIPASMAKLMDVEAEIPLTTVELDGLVVMKIMKHSHETSNANGLLLGIDLDGVLNVTNSFAMPNVSDDDEKSNKAAANARYQVAMLRQLNEVQGDDSVAFRLSAAFRRAHKAKKFDTPSLINNQLTFSSIMEEFPVTVRNSSLLSAFISSLSQPSAPTSLSPSSFPSAPIAPSFTSFDLTPSSHLERLVDAADAVKAEESNLAYHARQHARERTRAEAKRADENAQRAADGLPPLTEEDFARMFKLPPEPSRLESMLLLGQLDAHAKTTAAASAAEMVKMYLARPETARGAV
ncbi:hypothetical protein FRC08_018295 [Ceratobasidium sp. 394]|nr:hypothetical protein FRC08_018295 [Ceratobasidium sp. 394]